MRTLFGILILVTIGFGAYFFFLEPATEITEAPDVYADPAGAFTFLIPAGWHAHPQGEGQVILTPSSDFTLPEATEGYAIGNQMVVGRGSIDDIIDAETNEDYLRGIGATEESEFFVSRAEVTSARGVPMTRVVLNAAAADGQTLLYVLFPGGRDVVTFSHYPFEEGSDSAAKFQVLVDSFELDSAR